LPFSPSPAFDVFIADAWQNRGVGGDALLMELVADKQGRGSGAATCAAGVTLDRRAAGQVPVAEKCW
jgi:hypothetical protein